MQQNLLELFKFANSYYALLIKFMYLDDNEVKALCSKLVPMLDNTKHNSICYIYFTNRFLLQDLPEFLILIVLFLLLTNIFILFVLYLSL